MSHPSDIKWLGSPLPSPVLSQGAESRHDAINAAPPQPPGGVHALLDGMYTELSCRQDAQQLLLLTRRRHLLTLTRQLVVHQMSLGNYIDDVCELLRQSAPPVPSNMVAVCARLRKVTSYSTLLHRRLQSDPCLYPIPSTSMLDATRNIPRVLLLMAIKATLLTEQYILHVLRRVARVPAEVTADLCRSLTTYNQVVADLSKQAIPWAELRPFSLCRVLEILAEERSRLLVGEFYRTWFQGGLEDTLRREMEAHMSQARDPTLRPSNSLQETSQVVSGLGVIDQEDILRREMSQARDPTLRPANSLQETSQVVSGQRSFSTLGVLVQEDRSQVTPVLQILVGLDQKTWNKVPSGPEPALYSQYCVRLWLALYSQVFHGVSSGMRGPRTPPGLMLLPKRVCARAVRVLRETLMSEDLPEPCVSLGLSLCQRLLCVRSLNAWDSTLCQALSSALTDKCAASSSLGRGDPFPGNHSRTSGILVTLCQHLSSLQLTPSSTHQSSSREPRNPGDRLFSELCAVTCQEGVLSRCTVSLHLCDTWLRSRTQIYTSSGSLAQLVLITHGDLPVIKVGCRSLVAAAENADFLSSPQTSCMSIQRTRDVLEGLVVSLPHVLGSVCSRRAQDFFQHMMPAGRHWRGKLVTGPDLAPSEYAEAAVSAVVVPVLDGVTSLRMEEQVPAVCVAVGVFMEAWMGHILREKIKFSLQGALQLRRDFEGVREVLRSRESRMPPEVVQTALALPVFAQADNAIVCLLQQPSRKTYLQSGSCAVFSCCPPLCRVAVDSMSDSLQSLDSLERRAWDGDVSRRVPRHSHDSYLPHNQRQWLSLRVNKTWNGLSLPWEG